MKTGIRRKVFRKSYELGNYPINEGILRATSAGLYNSMMLDVHHAIKEMGSASVIVSERLDEKRKILFLTVSITPKSLKTPTRLNASNLLKPLKRFGTLWHILIDFVA